MRDPLGRLLRAGLLTGVTDALFATTSAVAFGTPVTRLWQGVASAVLGPAALAGGARTAAFGLLVHFGVAFGWSAVFLALYLGSRRLRELTATPAGVVGVAAAYGPAIWLVMSLVVVPALVRRPPTITARWWVQLVGHVPFVALPIVASIARGRSAPPRDPVLGAAAAAP